jgi:hypothetical protein
MVKHRQESDLESQPGKEQPTPREIQRDTLFKELGLNQKEIDTILDTDYSKADDEQYFAKGDALGLADELLRHQEVSEQKLHNRDTLNKIHDLATNNSGSFDERLVTMYADKIVDLITELQFGTSMGSTGNPRVLEGGQPDQFLAIERMPGNSDYKQKAQDWTGQKQTDMTRVIDAMVSRGLIHEDHPFAQRNLSQISADRYSSKPDHLGDSAFERIPHTYSDKETEEITGWISTALDKLR